MTRLTTELLIEPNIVRENITKTKSKGLKGQPCVTPEETVKALKNLLNISKQNLKNDMEYLKKKASLKKIYQFLLQVLFANNLLK